MNLENNNKKNIMIQGTASSVGKSIIAAALCRIFTEDSYRTAPFKSQNMSLNSFVTAEGLEMGRAQVVQAAACKKAPSVLMNPILLKPSSDTKAQVIIMGKVDSNRNAKEYHLYKPELESLVLDAYRKLAAENDIVVIEGAGSPAEINLREHDIVNMGMAELVDAPVVLVADIDRGGVFASIVGTIFLLPEAEKRRVRGIIINKFRGDIALLEPGIRQLEEIINIPVLGVVPFLNIALSDEDSVTERFNNRAVQNDIDICVIRTPKISNFTDFDVFELFEDVSVRYATTAEGIGNPDIVIIPGSKNTIEDMHFLRDTGIAGRIIELQHGRTLIVGICGGYQMLGRRIEDPFNTESDLDAAEGLGLVGMHTVLDKEKITRQFAGKVVAGSGMTKGLSGQAIAGYEIHMGKSIGIEHEEPLVESSGYCDGIIKDNIIGTYVHGIFDNAGFTRGLLNNVRARKGLRPLPLLHDFEKHQEEEFAALARAVRDSIDMDEIYRIIGS